MSSRGREAFLRSFPIFKTSVTPCENKKRTSWNLALKIKARTLSERQGKNSTVSGVCKHVNFLFALFDWYLEGIWTYNTEVGNPCVRIMPECCQTEMSAKTLPILPSFHPSPTPVHSNSIISIFQFQKLHPSTWQRQTDWHWQGGTRARERGKAWWKSFPYFRSVLRWLLLPGKSAVNFQLFPSFLWRDPALIK